MKLVWKLLRQNINKSQLIGFCFVNLIGTTIILLGFQFYSDVNPIFSAEENIFQNDYYTITKKIGLFSNFNAKSTSFTQSDIEDIRKQSFVKQLGVFTPSEFSVLAEINAQQRGLNFSTQMFFESVPDNFIDVKSDSWNFSPASNNIPIILPKNYLDLYNFGFAQSNSMPKLTEELISLVKLDITIIGENQKYKRMTGNIVGFSNRINTILVPQKFMIWANMQFGKQKEVNPSRIILEIEDVSDPHIATYFSKKGWEISEGKSASGQIVYFLRLTVIIVVVVGLIFCLLSFFVLALSIYLLMEKNMSKLKLLRLIGYAKSYVVRPYELLTYIINLFVLMLSLLMVYLARNIYIGKLSQVFNLSHSPSFAYTVGLGLLICIIFLILNRMIIRNKVK